MSPEFLRSLGLAREEYILYPANFRRYKNHEMLLTAFLMAQAAGLPNNIKLALTGAPHELRIAAAALGLNKHVVFVGFVADADLAVLLENWLGVVFPSLYEGFGIPVLEAMASGRPVACSNCTSLPSWSEMPQYDTQRIRPLYFFRILTVSSALPSSKTTYSVCGQSCEPTLKIVLSIKRA
jgi:glycosyltransferase involved in cell wall biosynthesis